MLLEFDFYVLVSERFSRTFYYFPYIQKTRCAIINLLFHNTPFQKQSILIVSQQKQKRKHDVRYKLTNTFTLIHCAPFQRNHVRTYKITPNEKAVALTGNAICIKCTFSKIIILCTLFCFMELTYYAACMSYRYQVYPHYTSEGKVI